MYLDTVTNLSKAARTKIDYLKRAPLSYITSSALAGAYIGIGIALIFGVGAPLAGDNSVFLKTLMGVSFGIALTLVVFAGAELFTGNNMCMIIGMCKGKVRFGESMYLWAVCWVGNLIGSLVLAGMIVGSGALSHAAEFIEKVSLAKMTYPGHELFLRAALCNWLVCLAMWMCARTKSDAAKCILIFWCLFAFISCGYEHSIANMTLLGMALIGPHEAALTWGGFFRNMFYVTAGNIVGGGLLVGAAYHIATYKEKPSAE